MRAVLAFLVALAFLPAVAAQHEHHEAGAGVMIGHDSPADGREFVGNLAHFAILDLGVAGKTDCYAGGGVLPQCHQQNHIRVTLNGVVLMETTPDSGHDYDGVYLFDVAFPAVGNYTVLVLGDAGELLSSFSGYVVDPTLPAGGEPNMKLKLDGPTAATAGTVATYTFYPFDTGVASGVMVKHSDSWFEVRQGTNLVFRTKTHTHEEAQSVAYAFPQAGTYTVRVTSFIAFPSMKARLFSPVVAERTVTVAASANPPSGTPTAQVPDAPLMNGMVSDTHDAARTLVGTYDPWTTVGPATQMHLTALAMDPATRMPVPHVDFEATLKDNLGHVLYHSDTLHEYDGIYELAAVEPIGLYTLSVDAAQGDWKAHIDMPYTVMPPVLATFPSVPSGAPTVAAGPPLTGGAILYDVGGLTGAASGKPFNLTIHDHNLLGQPFPHSEIDYQILGENGVPALAGKLHTHGDGDFQLTVGLPAGSYRLVLSPLALEPEPTLLFYGKAVGDSLSLPFTVASGPGFPLAQVHPTGDLSNPAPDAGVLVALAAVGLAMALRRRA